MSVLRLDRMLSGQGVAARGEIRRLLAQGAVTVNGKRAASPALKVDTEKDEITVGGVRIDYQAHIYIMMNKPAGVISASDDPRHETVLDLLPDTLRRPGLFPAGRLDRDTEGFLLITDDGNFAHNILSPKKHVQKEYYAVIDSPLTVDEIDRFQNGLVIDGGLVCRPAVLRMLEGGASNGGARVTVTICEGKFHQIKRMFQAVGHEVLYLRRTAMGGLRLDESLAPGQARALTRAEAALIAPGVFSGGEK